MECRNVFCIYQKDNQCTMGDIELDSAGVCQSCIYPDIPTEILETAKEQLRKKFVEEDSRHEQSAVEDRL